MNEEFDAWIRHGIDMGWVSEPFCSTHEIDPFMSDEEQQDWEAGLDPCCHVLRLAV